MGIKNTAGPICILGMPRSGTSIVAQMLRAGGVQLGAESDLVRDGDPEARQPDRCWEHRGFTRLNERLLEILESGGGSVLPLEPGWSADAACDDLRREAVQLAESMPAGAAWGWKDPRAASTLEFWRSVFPGLRLLLCLRNPVEIALDVRRGDDPGSLEQSLEAWERYHAQLGPLPASPACEVVHYGSMLYDPEAELARVLRALGLPVPASAVKEAAAIASGCWYRLPVTDDLLAELHAPAAVQRRFGALCARAGEVHARMTADERHQARLCRRGVATLAGEFLQLLRDHAEVQAQHEDLLVQHDACLGQHRLLRGSYPRRRQLVEQRIASLARHLRELFRPRRAAPSPAGATDFGRWFWLLRHQSGLIRLFSAFWYLKQYPEVAEAGVDPLVHFLAVGWLEGRSPNPYFERAWYLERYPDVAAAGADPLFDYLTDGWRRGRNPGPNFDVSWYLLQNPDVARAGVEPLGHYLQSGWRENRNPSPTFAIESRLQACPEIVKLGIEPFTFSSVYRAEPKSAGHGEGMILTGVVEEEIRASYANPEASPDHEREETAVLVDLAVRLVAFYLPQFHPIAENDQHWGRGFTEWTNVSKARPMFRGHYQPQLPGELGFYDLRLDEVMSRQVELARQHGVHGFCFYRYWFNGRTVLERPVERFLARPELDLRFCLCWANENWTRRWDGREEEVLLSQVHSAEDDLAFIADAVRFFRDPRYIAIDGKPLLVVYHTQKMPEPERTAERWRSHCERSGLPGVFLVAAQTCGFTDPRPIGFDAAVQFPPHNSSPENLAPLIDTYGPFFGQIHEYAALAELNCVQTREYPLFNTVCTAWDNTARRGPAARIFHHATPREYQQWLGTALDLALRSHAPDRRLVFINAWNEWAEGAHLEPDRRHGYAYLNATTRALLALQDREREAGRPARRD